MTLNTRADAHVRVTGSRLQPDAAADHHLLRIGLEALTNALKHAGATRIDIELRFGIDSTDLIVVDNGRGITAGEGAHRCALRPSGRSRTSRQARRRDGD